MELLPRPNRIHGMGEIKAKVRLENAGDALLKAEGRLGRRKLREAEMEAIVDTGAVMMLLPQEVVEKLGLSVIAKEVVTLANEQKVTMERAGPIQLSIGDRVMNTDCLVGPPGCEALVGQLVMEALDLIPDPARRTLTPRPESPFRPNLKMKGMVEAAVTA